MTFALRTDVHPAQPRPAMLAPPRVVATPSPVPQGHVGPAHPLPLVELVFEGCSEASALRIVARLCAGARGGGAFAVRGVPRAGVPLEDVLAMLRPEWPCATAELHALRLDALCVEHGRVTLFRDRGTCDVSLVFPCAGDAEDDVAEALHAWARQVVEGEELAAYYAGGEPAVDESSRFFTDTPRGV